MNSHLWSPSYRPGSHNWPVWDGGGLLVPWTRPLGGRCRFSSNHRSNWAWRHPRTPYWWRQVRTSLGQPPVPDVIDAAMGDIAYITDDVTRTNSQIDYQLKYWSIDRLIGWWIHSFIHGCIKRLINWLFDWLNDRSIDGSRWNVEARITARLEIKSSMEF